MNELKYISDKIRLAHLETPFDGEQIDKAKLLDTWNGYDDLTRVIRKGEKLFYYEGFVLSCWQGLFAKKEYKGLTRKDAVFKLVNERFTIIAKLANLKIDNWHYKQSILFIEFSLVA